MAYRGSDKFVRRDAPYQLRNPNNMAESIEQIDGASPVATSENRPWPSFSTDSQTLTAGVAVRGNQNPQAAEWQRTFDSSLKAIARPFHPAPLDSTQPLGELKEATDALDRLAPINSSDAKAFLDEFSRLVDLFSDQHADGAQKLFDHGLSLLNDAATKPAGKARIQLQLRERDFSANFLKLLNSHVAPPYTKSLQGFLQRHSIVWAAPGELKDAFRTINRHTRLNTNTILINEEADVSKFLDVFFGLLDAVADTEEAQKFFDHGFNLLDRTAHKLDSKNSRWIRHELQQRSYSGSYPETFTDLLISYQTDPTLRGVLKGYVDSLDIVGLRTQRLELLSAKSLARPIRLTAESIDAMHEGSDHSFRHGVSALGGSGIHNRFDLRGDAAMGTIESRSRIEPDEVLRESLVEVNPPPIQQEVNEHAFEEQTFFPELDKMFGPTPDAKPDEASRYFPELSKMFGST